MGVFEMDVFVKGIFGIVDIFANLNGITIIGGGDFVVVVEKVGFVDKMFYIFIGGGVFFELFEGKVLLGVVVLDEVCM